MKNNITSKHKAGKRGWCFSATTASQNFKTQLNQGIAYHPNTRQARMDNIFQLNYCKKKEKGKPQSNQGSTYHPSTRMARVHDAFFQCNYWYKNS